VRVGQADNLTGITGVGEYFLVAGEAGVKNDFAAATGASARRAPVKYAPVLEREQR
jgi:CO/xanthine dehydrogenase Mo-binding subunit